MKIDDLKECLVVVAWFVVVVVLAVFTMYFFLAFVHWILTDPFSLFS